MKTWPLAPITALLTALLACASAASPSVDRVIYDLDQDNDKRIGLHELVSRFITIQQQLAAPPADNPPELSTAERRRIGTEFSELDTDSDGYVDEQELMQQFLTDDIDDAARPAAARDDDSRPHDDAYEDAILHGDEELELSAEEQAIDAGFREASIEIQKQTMRLSDENGDRRLDALEFLLLRRQRHPELHRQMIPTFAKLHARQELLECDEDGDGLLDKAELQMHIERLWRQTHPERYKDEL